LGLGSLFHGGYYWGIIRSMIYKDLSRVPIGRYGVILADPPWNHSSWEGGGDRHPSRHYDVMSVEEIASLPVSGLAGEDCALFLWGCYPLIPEALMIVEAWGFDYRTVAFTWVKTNPVSGNLFIGCGSWTRANPEPCLLGIKGRPKRKDAGIPQLIVSPRREHSRKPEEAYHRIETLLDGPYLELFARTERPGWDAWGDEVGKFVPEPEQHSLL